MINYAQRIANAMKQSTKFLTKVCGLFMVLFLSFNLSAAESRDNYPFTQQAQVQQFQSLVKRVRCLVCQNQDISDSNAHLAQDLRQQVYEQIQLGHSDEMILDYLTDRYGDFVLFEPPLKNHTYLLWYGPFLFLLLAMAVFWRSMRRGKR